MTTDLQPVTANPLIAEAVKATTIYDMVAAHTGDIEAADANTQLAIAQAQAVRLCIAHRWGVDNPPAKRGPKTGEVSYTSKKGEGNSVAPKTAAARRAIARVPRDRLESWIDAQLAHPESAALKQVDFEKSQPFRTEDRRDELKALGRVRFTHKAGAQWTEKMEAHTLLASIVKHMDAGLDEGVARDMAKREAKTARLSWDRVQAGYDAPPTADAIKVCSCAEMAAHVEAGSLDAIFTDPPYPAEFLHCYDELAQFAVHALRPGGVLLAIAGQTHLLDVISRMNIEGLTYRWLIAYIYDKPRMQIHAAKVSVGWKPFLAFTRDGSHPKHYAQDAFKAVPKSGADKADHEWGQTVADMESIAKEWLRPNWKVCDPFCGAGGLLIGAKAAGCEVTGCDIDAAHVKTTLEKLA